MDNTSSSDSQQQEAGALRWLPDLPCEMEVLPAVLAFLSRQASTRYNFYSNWCLRVCHDHSPCQPSRQDFHYLETKFLNESVLPACTALQ